MTGLGRPGLLAARDIPGALRYSDRYDRPGRGSYRQGRMGSVCVTARGDCGGAGPLNAPCECYIPGFGPKRGAIGYSSIVR